MPVLVCRGCGTTYHRQPSRAAEGYCSKRCSPRTNPALVGESYGADPEHVDWLCQLSHDELVDHCTRILNRWDPDPLPLRNP